MIEWSESHLLSITANVMCPRDGRLCQVSSGDVLDFSPPLPHLQTLSTGVVH